MMDRRKREEAKKGPALGPLGWTDVEKQERRRLERERRDGSGIGPCHGPDSRPDWPGNVTAPWPSFEAGKTRRSSPSARTGSVVEPDPPSAQKRYQPLSLLAGGDLIPVPRGAVGWRVRRVGARDLGHLGVGQLPVEIAASLATRRIRPARNGSQGTLQYPHNHDRSLIFRYLSRHHCPDPPYARPCGDDPGAFPERDAFSKNLEPVSRRGACAPSGHGGSFLSQVLQPHDPAPMSRRTATARSADG